MKKPIQIIGLSLLIVALPAASWYFLKSGLDYRMASMDKLGEYGRLPETTLTLANGKTVSTSKFENQLVLTYIDDVGQDTTQLMKLYRQFQKRKDLHFLLQENDRFRLIAERNPNLWLLNVEDEGNQAFLRTMGVGSGSGKISIVDITGTIRNYYDFSDMVQIQQLVEHTAFLLPIEETEQAYIKREQEK